MTANKTWEQHTGALIDSANGFDIIVCRVCEFKHTIPIPTIEELGQVYRQEYYSVEKPDYIQRHREDLDWWNLVYSERYDTFEQILPSGRRRILDIGSGPGFFLLHGMKRGWKTVGMEPSLQAATHSRDLGLDVVEDFLTEQTAKKLGDGFDVVHLSEVLEHVPDPRRTISITRNLLSPGGLICVVVPNDYNPFQQVLREVCNYKPWWVAPPHHLNYFDADSLSRLLERYGFEIILREATFPIDIFLLMGENYVGDDALGRECHRKRVTFEKNLVNSELHNWKRKLYQTLANIGLGREVMLVGQKVNQ